MEIVKLQMGDSIELKVTGRLDAYWSEHLGNELKATIREGNHHLILDLSGVDYISSAGIRVLLTYYGQLSEINGSLSVSGLTGPAKSILETAGLSTLLQAAAPAAAPDTKSKKLKSAHASFEVFTLRPPAELRCKLLGRPELLEQCAFQPENTTKLRLDKSSFAFGVAAFGNDWNECKDRFGEFLAVSGAAAYLPTDGTNVPDYLVSSGNYFPELVVLYGVVCSGEFSHLLRFEAEKEAGAVSLNEVIETVCDALETQRLGAVVIAETAGLVGASLLKSPVLQTTAGPFHYPETVDWLSFTPERAHSRSLALVTGMTTPTADAPAVFRPFNKKRGLSGHFHAAAFPYRPLRKGQLKLEETVTTLFEAGSVEGLLHLLSDDREIGGAGESEFIRGACWIAPVTEMR
jgi:anti-anti-sigma factor